MKIFNREIKHPLTPVQYLFGAVGGVSITIKKIFDDDFRCVTT